MMTQALLEQLLQRGEGTIVDLKRIAYPLTNDEQKGEMIKDILAFANTFRDQDAYILIGVEEGPPPVIVGVNSHPDDATLQQIVNSKTNRAVEFSYQSFATAGVEIGVIRIPKQVRPLYPIRDFGRLKKEVTYLRHGSSTAQATPDDIARMGREDYANWNVPDPAIEFWHGRERLGTRITVTSLYLELPPDDSIPLYETDQTGPVFLLSATDPNYYVQYAHYLRDRETLVPTTIGITNTGRAALQQPVVQIRVPKTPGFVLAGESNLPQPPDSLPAMGNLHPNLTVTEAPAIWIIEATCADVAPQHSFVFDTFYIGLNQSGVIEAQAVVYANNLATPVVALLQWNFEVRVRSLSVEQLMQMIEE